MKKVLLVQCPCAFGTEMPPLGLGYLSSYLKKNHVDVSVQDLSILFYHMVGEEDKASWSSNNGYRWYLKDIFEKLPFITDKIYDEFVEKILSAGSEVLGFSIQNTSALFTREIIKRIKKRDPSKKIILGGPNCYNISEDDLDFRLLHGLEEFADVIVVGEGEKTLLAALDYLETGECRLGCRGIALPRGGKWMISGLPDPVRDLDILPFPDFDAFHLSDYTAKESFPILSSRGCVMRCVFCTDTYFWISYRARSAEAVVDEIVQAKEKYGKSFIHFNDSLVNGDRENFLKMCGLLIERRVGVRWGGNCRVDLSLGQKELNRMKSAGCQYLILGVESASNKILKLMRKGFTIEQAQAFIIRCKKAGIDVTANWIVGFPGETEDDFKATARFIKKHNHDIQRNTFSTLTINQFSSLQKNKEEFGVLLDGPHLGLWYSRTGENTISLRNERLKSLEEIESRRKRAYSIVRQLGE